MAMISENIYFEIIEYLVGLSLVKIHVVENIQYYSNLEILFSEVWVKK